MKRTLALLLALVLTVGLLTACDNATTENTTPSNSQPTQKVVAPSTKLNSPPKEDQIISDANATKLIDRPALFTSCEVIKRQSNPENKEDVVYVRLTAEQSFLRAEQQYRLLYNYYDEGGWILDEVTPENEDEWTVAYLDAAGNNFLDDVVWLDAFFPGVLSEADHVRCWTTADGNAFVYTDGAEVTVMGEAQGYTQRLEQGVYSADLTMFFPVCVDKTGSSYPAQPVSSVFPASDGTFRVIAQDINGNQGYGLYDWDGRLLANYDYITWYAKNGVCAVMDENGGYGAIDENGNVLLPTEYGSDEEAMAAIGYQVSPLPEYTGVEFQGNMDDVSRTPWNGVFSARGPATPGGNYSGRLVNASGAEILPQVEGSHAYAIWGLVAVFSRYDHTSGPSCRPGYFRFYDLDGNCRSPELHMACNDEPRIIEKDGHYGILPSITTGEESLYYHFLWGMEHQS